MLPKGRPQDLAVKGAFAITLVEGKKVYNRSVGGDKHLSLGSGTASPSFHMSLLSC